MSGSGEASGDTGGQVVVGTGRLGLGRDAYCGLGGRTDWGGVGYRWNSEGDGLNSWEDTVANLILGMETNAPLVYDLGLELRHPIMSMLGGRRGGRLERERQWFYFCNQTALKIDEVGFCTVLLHGTYSVNCHWGVVGEIFLGGNHFCFNIISWFYPNIFVCIKLCFLMVGPDQWQSCDVWVVCNTILPSV